MKLLKASKENLKEIITALKNGAVLVLPTDTVYGLVCDASNERSVEKIFEIKKREKTKPLAVFVKDISAVEKIAFVGEKAKEFLKDSKITVILKAKNVDAGRLSNLVYKDSTIGMRIPKHEFLNLILEKFDGPLAQTSANISGQGAIIEIDKIKSEFQNEDILIVDAGDLPGKKPSKVIDLTGEQVKVVRD
jgi:L-threonylcarbamoyladenylate synthase